MMQKLKRNLAVLSAKRALSAPRAHAGFAAGTPEAVFAPTSHGSFGDEALALGTGHLLDALKREWVLVAPGNSSPWHALGVEEIQSTETGLSRGGVIWAPPAGSRFGGATVIGADSIDFSYGIRNASAKLSALNVAAASGVPATLFNFSLRETLSSEARNLLRRIHPDVKIRSRDPLTQQRARELFQRDDVSAAPDVGIFLAPRTTDASKKITEWASTRRVAALTVNNHLGVNFSSQDMLSYFTRLGELLVEAGFEVMVLAHDVREEQNDPELARAVASALSGDTIAATPSDAREAKAMLAPMSLHLTSRMHAGVASLSQAIPTIGLDYVDKFRGQFSWYGVGDHVVPWNSHDVVEQVTEMIVRVGQDVDLPEKLRTNTSAWKSDLSVWGLA